MEDFNPALFMENNPSILCPQMCYKDHSMTLRKSQLQKQNKQTGSKTRRYTRVEWERRDCREEE